MYAQCGSLISANNLFDSLQNKDVVTWNALINGSAQTGGAESSLLMFHKLQTTGLQPDHGTIMGTLSACAFLDKLTQGTCVYGLVIKKGFESDLHVKNALLDMFAKCGDLTAAKTIFCEIKSSADVVSWNTMIAGYLHNGFANEAMSAFFKMRAENFMPNLVTLVSIIPTAACLSSLRDGFSLHSITIKTGFESHVVVKNSLIDMYSKCGRLEFARDLFDQMNCRSIITWNAMLAGYAMHGIVSSAIDLLSQMKESCILPDSVSFVSLLSACRHGGLVDEGRKFFKSMCTEYGLEPNKKHYAAMVDLLGCAGLFDEALKLIDQIPKEIDASVWGALLGAAKIHSNLKMGELAVEHLVQLEPKSPSHFVILANIYASSGRWADAGKMRTMIRNMGLCKSPGCSWVDSRKTSHLTIGAV
ncbi:hypothetical protein HPP92_006652 [Vanilla planifolia]|uniref:Pentatricopeptide repeat-containing protein n=1 Tax=Vanilla planifolia TaxID=51239 RepID=A0A835V9B2_VANPL|nr:hypothetical protein HPP92_006652 [Vanilla planifolia]